jgi:hypothetical protein
VGRCTTWRANAQKPKPTADTEDNRGFDDERGDYLWVMHAGQAATMSPFGRPPPPPGPHIHIPSTTHPPYPGDLIPLVPLRRPP